MHIVVEEVIKPNFLLKAESLAYGVLYVMHCPSHEGTIVARIYNSNPSLCHLVKLGHTPESGSTTRASEPFRTTWEIPAKNDAFRFSECNYKVTLCNEK